MGTRLTIALLFALTSLTLACDGELKGQSTPGEEGWDMKASKGVDMTGPGTQENDLGTPGATDMEQVVQPGQDMLPGVDMRADMGEEPEPPKEASGNELTPQQAALFTCSTGVVEPSPARQRLIDRGEWQRNVGTKTETSYLSPFDPLQHHPFSTFVEGESMNAEVLDVYMNMSGTAAHGWQGPQEWEEGRALRWSTPLRYNPLLYSNLGEVSCMIDERSNSSDAACVEKFVKFLLERGVLHRPAKPEELSALQAYAQRMIDAETQPVTRDQRRDTVRKIVQAAWMTTGALFSGEGFDHPADAEGISTMSDWEIAHALTFALGHIDPGAVQHGDPDDIGAFPLIVEAAKNGTISDPDTLAMLVATYVSKDGVTSYSKRSLYRASYGVQQFFREWLGYMEYLQQTKDSPHATTAHEKGIVKVTYDFAVKGTRSSNASKEPRLFEQFDDMIARIIHDDRDVLAELLTSRRYYIAADQMELLGNQPLYDSGGTPQILYSYDDKTAPDQEGRWATLPDTVRRAGVLTHPAWLASHSLNFENDPNPVHRGKWVRENLLCEDVPPTPITVEAALDPETRDQSTRQRVKEKTEQPACVGCHDLMNPLGYPFEIYNHIGILRADDHGQAPDGSSVLIKMPEESLNGPVSDAVEMSEKFAQSQHVKRCFIRQSFRYFMGREETMADACILSQMEQAYDEQGSFKQMLTVLWSSPAFLERRHPTTQP